MQGAGARGPRQHKRVLPLKTRYRIRWSTNHSQVVCLALQQGLEVEELEWCVGELYTDIEDLMMGEAPAPEDKAGHKGNIDDSLHTILADTLETLQDHQSCHAAYYLSSKNTLKVVRKEDNETMVCRVKSLNRQLNESQ